MSEANEQRVRIDRDDIVLSNRGWGTEPPKQKSVERWNVKE
jgi:hypothetical protein